MKTEKEIKKKIKEMEEKGMESIKRRYPNHPVFRSNRISPRLQGRIVALKWVLDQTYI